MQEKLPMQINLLDLVVSAIAGRAKWEVVNLFLEEHPTQVQSTNEYGLYVLHKVVTMKCVPFELVERIVKMFPAAVTTPDYFGCLPIHHAIGQSTRSVDNMRIFGLLLKRSSPLRPEDIDNALNNRARVCGDLPVIPYHIIEREILPFLGNPLLFDNSYGENPLHIMIRNNAPITMIDAYLKNAPKAICAKNFHKDTPIHTALRSKSSFELIKLLLDMSPRSLGEADNYGNTPLHASFIYGSSLATKNLIAVSYPAALQMKNEEGQCPQRMVHEYGL